MKKYILSNRVAGLGDCLFHLYFSWWIARKTKRTLIIDWCHSFYNYSNPSTNRFLSFFQPLTHIKDVPVVIASELVEKDIFTRLIPVSREKERTITGRIIFYLNDLLSFFLIWPGGLSRARIIRAEPGFCMRYFRRTKQDIQLLKEFFSYFQPPRHIQNKIDQFAQTHFLGKKVIAVHMRTFPAEAQYDKDRIPQVVAAVNQMKEKLNDDPVVFLCTDNIVFLDQLRAVFPNGVFYEKEFPTPMKSDKKRHFIDGFMSQYKMNSGAEPHIKIEYKKRMIDDTVAEMFLLAKSDALVCYPADSGFTLYARHCEGGPKDIVKIKKTHWKQFR